MYIIGWILAIIAIALWRRDTTNTKTAYLALIEQLKSERMELDALKTKYEAILNKKLDENGKKEKTLNAS